MTTQLSEAHQNCQNIGIIMKNAASLEISKKKRTHMLSRSFPSYIVPLFQNESSCKTLHIKMSLISMWGGLAFM